MGSLFTNKGSLYTTGHHHYLNQINDVYHPMLESEYWRLLRGDIEIDDFEYLVQNSVQQTFLDARQRSAERFNESHRAALASANRQMQEQRYPMLAYYRMANIPLVRRRGNPPPLDPNVPEYYPRGFSEFSGRLTGRRRRRGE